MCGNGTLSMSVHPLYIIIGSYFTFLYCYLVFRRMRNMTGRIGPANAVKETETDDTPSKTIIMADRNDPPLAPMNIRVTLYLKY